MTEIDLRHRRLWTAVLDLALRDALNPLAQPVHRRQARAWVGTPTFAWVCRACDLDPHAVLERLNRREREIAEALLVSEGDGRRQGRLRVVA